MRFRTSAPACCLAIALVGLLRAQTQPAPLRVDPAVALKQVLKRVEPSFPPDVVAANPGAPFAADVVIKADGTVESVTVVVGPPALHAAAIAALKQWTFKPFMNAGRAVRVAVIIPIVIPDPARDAESKLVDDFYRAVPRCMTSLAAQSADAVPVCGQLARMSDALPADRRLERSQAHGFFGMSLYRANDFARAVPQFERSLEFRGPDFKDADDANVLHMLAETHRRLGNFQRADEYFNRAVQTFEKAMAAFPSHRADYAPNFGETLRGYSELKVLMGQTSEARALESRARSLTEAMRPEPLIPAARIGGVLCLGETAPLLTEDDVRQILALAPSGRRVWLLFGDRSMINPGRRWLVRAYLEPDVVRAGLRRGQLITLSAPLSADDAYSEKKTWSREQFDAGWAQVPLMGREPADIRGHDDRNRPFELGLLTYADPWTDDEIIGLVAHLRRVEKPVATDRAQLYTDVQPWTIESMLKWSDGSIDVQLRENLWKHGRGQFIKMKRGQTGWSILELRGQ